MRILEFRGVALVLVLAILGSVRPAHAQWAVIDAPNLQENITKYALSAQAHITQLSQWENQIMRAEMEAQNMMQNAQSALDAKNPGLAAVNALSSPMFAYTTAGDVAGALKDGLELTGQTAATLNYSRDAIGNALAEAEHGGNGYAAQMHASNQLLGVQAMIEEAQAQQQAALLAEKQAAAEEIQQNQDSATKSAQNTQYMAVRSGAQATDAASSICSGAVKDKYCQPLTTW